MYDLKGQLLRRGRGQKSCPCRVLNFERKAKLYYNVEERVLAVRNNYTPFGASFST
jgi:hypothetical protein